jgi:hypothetical protein
MEVMLLPRVSVLLNGVSVLLNRVSVFEGVLVGQLRLVGKGIIRIILRKEFLFRINRVYY